MFGDGQGGLACCDSRGCKDSDTTERLNRTELKAGRSFSSKEKVSFNFMAAVTICSDFGAPKVKVTVSAVPPSICHEVMGLDAIILVF